MSFLNWGGNRVHKNKKEDTVYICKDFFFFLNPLLLRASYSKRKKFGLWQVFLFPFAM